MKILVISHKYPPSIGGMQKQCFELVQQLHTSHEVVEVIYKGNGSNILFLFTAWWRALKILRRDKNIDLIYANDGLMAFFLTPLYWFSSIKRVVTIHGLDIVFPFGLYQKWARKYLNRFDAIIAVSDATAKELLSRGIRQDLVKVVKNGFDPSMKKGSITDIDISSKFEGIKIDSRRIIISIGRTVRRKGFSWFVNNILPALPEDVIYVVIGPRLTSYQNINRTKKWLPAPIFNLLILLNGIPMDEIELHDRIKELGYDDRVFHLSGLDHDEKNFLLKKADLFVMPNLKVDGDFEGFGLVALEAVMSETLCLASNIDGIPSAIQNGRNGYLVTSGDIEEWRSTVNKFLEDPETTKNKSKEFRDYTFKNCLSWKKMARQYQEIFEGIKYAETEL